MDGRTAIWADAVDEKSIAWPPLNIARTGVMRPKCPTTVTLTEFPSASAHGVGSQDRATSDGLTVRNDALDSIRTAHMTRLTITLHGWPGWNDVGFWAASNAPARAAPAIATREWKRRARSAAARSRSRMTGSSRASSTRD
jgi:hypothetical protein